MNERIKKLALEAFQPINDIASEGIADRHTFDQAWFQLYNQKFAQLIVQECAEICLEANDHKNILRHFGLSSTSEPQRPGPLDSSYPDGDGYWK